MSNVLSFGVWRFNPPPCLIMQPLTYHIRTFGCQMNDRDSERIAALLESMGYTPGDENADMNADIVVVNTCSVREKPQHKVYSELGRYGNFKKERPGAIIAVAGCVAQQEGEALLKRIPHLDLVIGTRAISRLPELVKKAHSGERVVAVEMNGNAGQGLFGAERPDPHSPTAFVVAMTGCSNHCAYCIVPSVRGPAISRPVDEILDEVRNLADEGVLEITLLGQNVNAYGVDIKIRGHKIRGHNPDLNNSGELFKSGYVPIFEQSSQVMVKSRLTLLWRTHLSDWQLSQR